MPNLEMFSLQGRVALVTGCSRGLGKALAFALGDAGAKVALNYFNDPDVARNTFEDYTRGGRAGMLLQGDATKPEEIKRMVAETRKQLGAIDILVLNATCAQPQKPFEDYDWGFCESMIDFFVKSPFFFIKECLPHMKQQKWGRIINIASETFTRGVPNFAPYVAAKGAQLGMMRSLSSELASSGITVNAISPGWIPVERHANDPQEAKDAYIKLVPAARWGIPQDLGGAVIFLSSNAASFITGQNLHVNGGITNT